MPRTDRLIPVLSVMCGGLTAVYVGLMVTTILFAAWQTQEASTIRETEGAISTLESSYYQEVAKFDSVNPSSLGFVAPRRVEYVAAVSVDSGLSFNGN